MLNRFIIWSKQFVKTVYGAIIAFIVFSASVAGVATFVLEAPDMWKNFRKDDKVKVGLDYSPCKEVFLSSSNHKIIVLPFFKTCETGRDVGLEIRNRLELLKYKDSLSIDVCYLDNFKQDPNFSKEKADKVRQKYKADQIIYGMNGSLNCTPQDTVMEVCVNYVSDKENINVKPISINQVRASLSDIRQGFLQADIDFIVYYFSAVSDAQKGRYKQSLIKLSKINKSNNHAKYYAFKGYVNEELQMYDSALINYNKALQLDITFDNLYQRASLYRLYLDKTDLAITDFKKAMSITKDSSQLTSVFFSLGVSFYGISQYDSSIKYVDLNLKYSKATENKENFAAMYAIKGHDLLALERKELAKVSFDKALKFDSNYNLALEGKAEYLTKNYNYEDALNLYNKLIKNDSFVYRYYIERANLYEKLDSVDRAKKDYLSGLKLGKYSSDVYQMIADRKKENNHLWESLYILKTASDKYPKDANLYFEIGSVFSDLNMSMQSITYYTKALALYPNHNPAHFNRGVLYIQAGRYKEAIYDFDRYIATKNFDPQAYYWRGIAKSNISDKSALSDIKKAASAGLIHARELVQIPYDGVL